MSGFFVCLLVFGTFAKKPFINPPPIPPTAPVLKVQAEKKNNGRVCTAGSHLGRLLKIGEHNVIYDGEISNNGEYPNGFGLLRYGGIYWEIDEFYYMCEGYWKVVDLRKGIPGIAFYVDGKEKMLTLEGNATIIYGNKDEYVGSVEIEDASSSRSNEEFSIEPHGEGTLNSGNIKYTGEFFRGRRNGSGSEWLRYSGQLMYAGEYLNGERHGRGMGVDDDGKYIGEWKRSKRDGEGIMEWSDGSVYSGWWKSGKFEGNGTMRYAAGGEYTGGWEDGIQEGKGRMLYADGSSYEGEWRKGMVDGYGFLRDSVGKIVREGLWYRGETGFEV